MNSLDFKEEFKDSDNSDKNLTIRINSFHRPIHLLGKDLNTESTINLEIKEQNLELLVEAKNNSDSIKKEKIIGIYTDGLGHKLWIQLDSFRYEYRFDIGYGFSGGTWSIQNDTLKFYPDSSRVESPIDAIYFENELEDLVYKNDKLYRLSKNRSIQRRRVKGLWGRQKRKNYYSRQTPTIEKE